MTFRLYTIISAALLLSSCSHYYAPVLYRNSAFYQPKPLSGDSAKSATYITGGLGASTGTNLNDNIYMGQLSLDEAHTFDNFNLSYGVFGYAGTYQNTSLQTTDAGYFNSKAFLGYGGKFSADFFTKMENIDFRLLGVEFLYSNETGEYADYRNAVKANSNIYSDPNNSVFSGALTSEVAWKGKRNPDVQYSVRGYLGTTFGNHTYSNGTTTSQLDENNNKINVGASFFVQIKKYCITFERQNIANVNLRFGYRF